MKFFEDILNIIFVQKYNKKELNILHEAPKHREVWIFSVFDYKQMKVREMIRYLKTRNDFMLKKNIAKYMSEHVIDYISDQQELSYFLDPLVIPIPISKKRLRERGFNQTHLLAKYFAKSINGIYQKNIIKKYTITKKQALIKNRVDRFKNVKGVFSIQENKKHLVKNRDIIIIDDLSTTGATLMEIKKVLKKNGARNVIAVTIAH
ncbi:MAG: hypothetical protein LR005_01850 [Candidatus Pacebacteria bacterium]|nr:hypothetical protein [Candidatus Paceibacterota bacterium]